MFDWLRRKEEVLTEFPDNESAFAHACTLRYPLLLNARIPALVLEEGRRGAEGEHWFQLRLAGQEAVLEIWGPTLPEAPAYPQVGDLVAFRIVRFATELPERQLDRLYRIPSGAGAEQQKGVADRNEFQTRQPQA